MILTANRKSLLDAMNLAAASINSRTPRPILACVLLEAEGQKLSLLATDLEVSVHQEVDGVGVTRAGKCAVNAEKLQKILKECTADTVSLELPDKDDRLRVTIADDTFKLNTSAVKEFPPEPKLEDGREFKVSLAALHDALGKTQFCVAVESTRYAFNGMLWDTTNNKLSLVATDGRRLAKTQIPVLDGAKRSTAIVPEKALKLLAKLSAEQLSVSVSDTSITFSSGGVRLRSNLIEGAFPPFEDVIPKDSDKKFVVAPGELLGAVRRAALLAGADSRLRLAFTAKGLKITGTSPEDGEAAVTLPSKYEGADIEIGFNASFLQDFLRVADAETVTLEMSAPNRPGLLRAGSDLLSVLMPMNLH